MIETVSPVSVFALFGIRICRAAVLVSDFVLRALSFELFRAGRVS
jgi:hypothetical protein